MSAIPEDFIKRTSQLSDDVTRPFPNSEKIYVTGSRPDLRVPMRKVSQATTHSAQGEEINPPIYIYDTSGPYRPERAHRPATRPARAAGAVDPGAGRYRATERPEQPIRGPAPE